MRPLLAPLVPLYVLVAVTVVLNCLNGGGGNPGFDAQRMLAALMVGVRILLLAWASLAATYSTASNQLMEAFASFLHPLRKLGAPVDDVALTLSLALRFIPLVAQQMEAVRRAQYSRGAAFDAGALAAIKAWGGTLVPVLVGMFRRGEVLATSMEAPVLRRPRPAHAPCQQPLHTGKRPGSNSGTGWVRLRLPLSLTFEQKQPLRWADL